MRKDLANRSCFAVLRLRCPCCGSGGCVHYDWTEMTVEWLRRYRCLACKARWVTTLTGDGRGFHLVCGDVR